MTQSNTEPPKTGSLHKINGVMNYAFIGIGLGALGIWYLHRGKKDAERGNHTWAMFNKNPLNIKTGSKRYQGEITPQGNIYKQFSNWEDGIAAAIFHLKRYFEGDVTGKRLNSIRLIINTWAPPTENDTNTYIQKVSTATQIQADRVLTFDYDTIWRLVKAMSQQEDGEATKEVTAERFKKAWTKI
jgi:hypothetical protein